MLFRSGFLDKVLTSGWAYKNIPGKSMPEGKLTHLSATVISTVGMPNMVYTLLYNNALKGVLIKGGLKFCGVKKIKWFKICSVENISDEKRRKWITDIEEYMERLHK